jgi:hypothetical protein
LSLWILSGLCRVLNAKKRDSPRDELNKNKQRMYDYRVVSTNMLHRICCLRRCWSSCHEKIRITLNIQFLKQITTIEIFSVWPVFSIKLCETNLVFTGKSVQL